MDCTKWDESGLLFASGELDHPQKAEFEQHIASCPSCAGELSQYTVEKKQFFTPEILAEKTPGHLDAKIISRCCKPMIPTNIGIFAMPWVRRAALSVLIFVIGLSAGGYFTFAYYRAKTSGSFANVASSAGNQPSPSAVASNVPAAGSASSLTLDTSKQSVPTLLKQGKNAAPGIGAPSQGIITVDLKKE